MLLLDEADVKLNQSLIEAVGSSPVSVGEQLRLQFLFELSRRLLRSKEAKAFPDLITFAYFCREKSINSKLEALSSLKQRRGWGILIHIAPANVPINFAFSFLFGFLSGNSNIVRLPSKTWPQVDLFLEYFEDLLTNPAYKPIKDTVLFLRSGHDSPWLDAAISRCDGLLVWGGDETVARFRSLKKLPRCVEMYFPNRVSSLLVDATAYLNASASEKRRLAEGFYNDTYAVDHNACSSPSRVLWVGGEVDIMHARTEFWDWVKCLMDSKSYYLDAVARIDRYLDLMSFLNKSGSNIVVQQLAPDLWLQDNPSVSTYVTRYGSFFQSSHADMEAALESLRVGEQTLTYFGFSSVEIISTLDKVGSSVDRVVPTGQALNMGFIWDGVNLLDRFSRHVEVS